MIDTLVRLLPEARTRCRDLRGHFAIDDRFALLTLHRPSNVDDPRKLAQILDALSDISRGVPIVFPIHPRTAESLRRIEWQAPPSLRLTEPLGYLDFLALQSEAALVMTDSGGVQEETTFLGVPCLTLRPNTERPVTVTLGTNVLVGDDLEKLRREARAAVEGRGKRGSVPPLWDGHAGERIADAVLARP
jgi:UDP-N-acetylglucosamine 2-epimerase (non-hydrolysing)